MKKKNLSEMIYDDIKNKIYSREYMIGKKLPTERILAEQYEVSRIPVREALKKLEEDHLIVRKPHSAPVVAAQSPHFFNNTVGSISSVSTVVPPLPDEQTFFNESLRLRRLIESEAARLAAHNIDTESSKLVEQALFASITEIRKLKNNQSNDFLSADVAFHRYIVELSGSPFLLKCFDSMSSIFAWQQAKSLSMTQEKDDVITYHSEIYEALLSKDGDASYNAMYKHLSRVENIINASGKSQPL